VTVAGAAAVKSVPATTHVTKSVSVRGSVAHPFTNADKVNVKGVGVRRSANPESVYKTDLAPDQLSVGGACYGSVDACDGADGVYEWKEGKEGEPYGAWELHRVQGPCLSSRDVACHDGVRKAIKIGREKGWGGESVGDGLPATRSERRDRRPYTCA